MINIPNKPTHPLNKNQVSSLNCKIESAFRKETIASLNEKRNQQHRSAPQPTWQLVQSQPVLPRPQQLQSQPVPKLLHPLNKGLKTALGLYEKGISKIKVCFGWNILDTRCDMDASAFLLGENGRVLDERWLVFYNQPLSPDRSVSFLKAENGSDREQIYIDLKKLNLAVQKIVFVLTIDEAFSKNLNFGMIRDAYVRLINDTDNQEIASFCLEEYYQNVTSMTMAELYLHNDQWKLNPVGNGVHQDLAGQCRIYGVEIG